ncbi:MAG TPA: hypothetical protein VJJ25_03475 [Nitrosopumilaceae archaeon]|nr:hypothetical protein [Nitrosopumilaceae archaeon]
MDTKLLEIIGLALIGGMIYAMFGGGKDGPTWSLFWPCAVGVVAINVYRTKKKKRANK